MFFLFFLATLFVKLIVHPARAFPVVLLIGPVMTFCYASEFLALVIELIHSRSVCPCVVPEGDWCDAPRVAKTVSDAEKNMINFDFGRHTYLLSIICNKWPTSVYLC